MFGREVEILGVGKRPTVLGVKLGRDGGSEERPCLPGRLILFLAQGKMPTWHPFRSGEIWGNPAGQQSC
jgi:hypothetical protein